MGSSYDEGVEEVYSIEMTDEALYAYSEIPSDKVYARMGRLIDFLARHPYYGEEYNPSYESARPPVNCRVFFCAQYGAYYHVNEEKRLVTLLAVENQRRDPMARFMTGADN